MNWLDQTKNLLIELIQSEPVNPTSNEEKAAKLVYSLLKKHNIEAELLHKEGHDKRLNVVAKLPGKDPHAAKLALLGHLDVVPAGNPSNWKHPPFAGIEADGCIWGRGALDCLVTVASEVIALIRLKEEGFQPEGDIILICEADEEEGAQYGAEFLTKEHWDLVGADYLINEGGGIPIKTTENKTQYVFSNAEKGPFWMDIKIKGSPGHASVPNNKKNTLVKAAKIINNISKYTAKIRITQNYKEFIEAYGLPKVLGNKYVFSVIYPLLKMIMPDKAAFINAMVRQTFSPTMIKGGEKANIIPDEIELTVDSRIVPEQTFEEAKEELERAIGKKYLKDVFIQPKLQSEGSISTFNSPLTHSIQQTMKNLDPQAELVPFILSGTTDSRYWREKGSMAYGFAPVTAFLPGNEIANLAHNNNERISIDSIEMMHEFMYQAAKNFQSEQHEKII